MGWGWVRSDDYQVGGGALGEDERIDVMDEPVERFAVGDVTEAAEEQQRIGMAAFGAIFVAGGIDAGAETRFDFPFELRQEA